MTHAPANTPSQAHFEPTRAEALRRLHAFLPRAGARYAADRNDDPGPDERGATSMLSPYLRRRMLDEREILAAVLETQGPAKAEKYIQEVCWRTYFKGWLEARPGVWDALLDGREHDLDALGSGGRKVLEQAQEGRTGIDGFDDWARELVETGWLHNHARMWFSSIWIFTLRLPWTLGADFFLRHLVDADPASNTLSWRWTAGLHTRGKTYLATPDNIARYTGGRFAPKGLATRAVALDEPSLGKAQPLSARPQTAGAAADALLLVTDEDLAPDWLAPAGGAPFAGVAVARTIDVGQGGARGEPATAFAAGALTDAAARLCPPGAASLSLEPADVLQAAERAGVRRVVTAEAPVGATSTALARLTGALAGSGVELVQVRRPWDAAFWPHATRGYGAVRAVIPELLADAGLPSG